MMTCPQNQWSAEGLRSAVQDAARARAASLILAGADPRVIEMDVIETSVMESWLDAALPAGTA